MRYLLLVLIFPLSTALVHCGGKNKKPAPKPFSPPKKAAENKPAPKPEPPKVIKSDWSYKGATGPEFWGDLNKKYKACREGRSQSPVNLIWSRPTEKVSVTVSYETSLLRMVDNGHAITLVVDPGSQISIRGDIYRLMQVHFHTPSEHQFSGKTYPLEIHFVHQNAKGKLAVVGVMGTIGQENPTIKKILKKFPIDKNKEFRYLGEKWSPRDLLPNKWHYYSYSGSLTTPPCSEGVNWSVVNTPIELSLEQVNMLQQVHVNNTRPIQPLNGRKVINY